MRQLFGWERPGQTTATLADCRLTWSKKALSARHTSSMFHINILLWYIVILPQAHFKGNLLGVSVALSLTSASITPFPCNGKTGNILTQLKGQQNNPFATTLEIANFLHLYASDIKQQQNCSTDSLARHVRHSIHATVHIHKTLSASNRNERTYVTAQNCRYTWHAQKVRHTAHGTYRQEYQNGRRCAYYVCA